MASSKSPNWKALCWPLAAIAIGALVSLNPFFEPHLSPGIGIAAWFADLALVLILSVHPLAARAGIILAGLFFAVPCFLWAPPLSRALLMCCMSFPFALAAVPLFAPPTADFRTRLALFFTWGGMRKITRRASRFDLSSLLCLIAASVVFAAALAWVNVVPAVGCRLLARWLAGGVMIFAFAEMIVAGHDFLTTLAGLSAPALMRSPFLATSVGEFWAKRWNRVASALLFRPLFFALFAWHGTALALFITFFVSAAAHVLLAFMAMGRWKISLVCGAFFLVQPLFILVERWLNTRLWPTAAARVWTLAVLAITSPLFVEPALQIITPSLGGTNQVLLPAIAALGFVMLVNVFFLAGQLVSCPKFMPNRSG
jgi:hypothetical protein